MGTHLRVLGESYQMNTNMTGFRWFSKIFASLLGLCALDKVASALEGLFQNSLDSTIQGYDYCHFLSFFYCIQMNTHFRMLIQNSCGRYNSIGICLLSLCFYLIIFTRCIRTSIPAIQCLVPTALK